tara:strand:+ start:2959 stop:3945 length:987 start_codon:yes stop_codon:yes gene_type:complete
MEQKEFKLSVGRRIVNTELRNIKIKDLHFYPGNPRITSILMNVSGKIDDEKIHKLFKEGQEEATHSLYRKIKKDGNVNEPLVIYNNQTLEGNTRLWVLRELYTDAKTQKEKEKWSIAPCRVVKDKLSGEEIDAILCSYHIKKKKDWEPFEQACYFYRMNVEDKKSLNQISKLTDLGVTKISDYIKTFKEMKKRNAKVKQFNYYYETIRQPEVKKAKEKIQQEILNSIDQEIKLNKISTASDVRKISTILKDQRVVDKFLKGKINIYRAEEMALQTNPQQGDPLLKKVNELEEDLGHIELEKLKSWKKDKTKIKILKKLRNKIDQILGY